MGFAADEGPLPAGGAEGHLDNPLALPVAGRDLLSSGSGEPRVSLRPRVLGEVSESLLAVACRVPGRRSEAHLGRVAGRGPPGEGRREGASVGGAQARKSEEEADRWRRGRDGERGGGNEGEAEEGDLARA